MSYPVLIVETENTKRKETILNKFAVCYNYKDKNKVLKHFKQPTCTGNKELLDQAMKYDNLFDY